MYYLVLIILAEIKAIGFLAAHYRAGEHAGLTAIFNAADAMIHLCCLIHCDARLTNGQSYAKHQQLTQICVL